MFNFRLIFVIFCFVPDLTRSENVTISTSNPVVTGISPWCKKAKDEDDYPKIPAECCVESYGCDKYVERGRKKYGVTNRSTWTIRLCSCDEAFFNCLSDYMIPKDTAKSYFLFQRHTCLRRIPCSITKTCEEKYEFVNTLNYFAEHSRRRRR